MFRGRSLQLALAAVLVAAPARGEPASGWSREGDAALRLVDAGATPDGRLAAIEIQLSPGWKTYWRQPGASGVPPRFDFSGSTNVASAHVAFPVPERDAGEDGVTNVYHGRVVLPVTVRPRDPSAPVELKLVADYGACERICVPVRAENRLRLAAPGASPGPAAGEVRAVLASVPNVSPLGAGGALRVETVSRVAAPDGAAVLEIVAAAPEGSRPVLFAETGEGDYAPAPEQSGETAAGAGRTRFRMRFDEPELPKSGLRLTLATDGEAVETPVALDEIAPPP